MEDYQLAILKWKEKNPDKKYLDISPTTGVRLDGIGIVKIGSIIGSLRDVYKAIQEGREFVWFKDLTQEEIDWLNKEGMIWDYEEYQRNVFHKAILKWKEKNPDKDYLDIPSNARVKLDGIGSVKLGQIIENVREIYQAIQEGREPIGYKGLDQDEIDWLTKEGMIWNYEKFQREVFHKAILTWKQNNPDKKYLDVLLLTKIKLDGIGIVKLGVILNNLRDIYKAIQEGREPIGYKGLNQDEIDWLDNEGMIWNYPKHLRNIFHLAILKWKEEHPDQIYLDVPANTTVELEGIGLINIGSRIATFRKIYQAMQEGKRFSWYNDLPQEEIDWLTKEGMIWDYEKHQEDIAKQARLNSQMDLFEPKPIETKKADKPSAPPKQDVVKSYDEYPREICHQAILKWKEKNPDKRFLNIPLTTRIKLDGIGNVKLGSIIGNLRGIYQVIQEGRESVGYKGLTQEEIDWLTKEGMIWDYRKFQHEVLHQAILKWKEEHCEPMYLDVPRNAKIYLDGIGTINLGFAINYIRDEYQSIQAGIKRIGPDFLNQEEIDWLNNEGMIWDYEKYLSEPNQKKYEEKSNNEQSDDNSMIIKSEQQDQHQNEISFNDSNIKAKLNIEEKTLQKQFGRTKRFPIKSKETSPDDDPALQKYCVENGYNYDIVNNAIKLHDLFPTDSIESIMSRAIIDYGMQGQGKAATWIYEKYGNYVTPILTNLNLDSAEILKNMSEKTLTIEDAIRHNVFLSCIDGDKEKEQLETTFNRFVETVDLSKGEKISLADEEAMTELTTKVLKLNVDELSLIMNAFMKYMNTIKEYALYDVGLETDETIQFQKITKYGLTEDEVEESFFKPLEFDNDVLIGRQSELYRRRQLLRQYVIDWDFYTEEEKALEISKNNFTKQEVSYLDNTRIKINKTLVKMLKNKK